MRDAGLRIVFRVTDHTVEVLRVVYILTIERRDLDLVFRVADKRLRHFQSRGDLPGYHARKPPKIMLGSREAPGLPRYASPKVTRYKVGRSVSTVRRAWGGSDCFVAGPPDFSTWVSPGE